MLPKKSQLGFLDWELGIFFHFGIRSFFQGSEDWDEKPMPASSFCPDALDCDSWIRTAKEAGARYAILTCKHHDGFANWPTRFSDYSVASSPFRAGKGDVVREFTDACRRGGLKVGLYYSPAQWGGETACWSGREPSERDARYDDYFVGQITELLTGYGRIDYLWFDACGSGNHRYDRERIVSVSFSPTSFFSICGIPTCAGWATRTASLQPPTRLSRRKPIRNAFFRAFFRPSVTASSEAPGLTAPTTKTP